MLDKKQIYELVSSDDLVCSLAKKSRAELRELLGNDFARMKDFDQNNPHHCYDLLNHIIHTVLGIKRKGLSADDFIELRVAALFHDIAKPRVAKLKNGRTVFYNHSVMSAEIAYELLTDAGITGENAERILFYIKHHDDFINYKLSASDNPYLIEINEENITSLINKNAEEYIEKKCATVPDSHLHLKLINICIADVMAQSDEAYYGDKLADTKEGKLERLEAVREVLLKICG